MNIWKAQLDNRFIEANNFLASNDISANVAGIYALHQIAIDASKFSDLKGTTNFEGTIFEKMTAEEIDLWYTENTINQNGYAYLRKKR